MKMPAEVVYLLPLMLVCLLLVGGCASANGDEGAPNPVRVNRVPYRGWDDAVLMTNDDVVVVIVPQIARIMKYATVGGENLLWEDEKLVPEVSGSQGTQGPVRGWENFGGARLWPAPEEGWKKAEPKPFPWELDRGACQVEITPENVVRLKGLPCPAFGLRYDREIKLAPKGSRLELKQTAVNISNKPVLTAVWDVTEVKPDCVAFVPLGPGARYRMTEKAKFRGQWTTVGDMMLLKPSPDPEAGGKAFFSGPPGWLGCKRGDQVYLKVFEIDKVLPPDPETPREVYTCADYVELEAVGPGATLQPGESTTLTESWYLLPAGKRVKTDEDLVELAQELAESVTPTVAKP